MLMPTWDPPRHRHGIQLSRSMLAFDGHHLASSPLCLSVPLEGTDKVPGLHAIERVAADQEDEAAPSSPQTASPFKIKGRRVQELVLDDVKAEPRPWSEFAGWGCRTLDDAYNVPPDLATLSIRVEVCWAVEDCAGEFG